MDGIPFIVEASLREAGFTAMEVLVLRRLLEYRELTLRELAARSGKSIGALDVAVKKLLRKGIMKKETINGASKLTLVSLESVRQWMDEDVRRKREMLSRRQENFDAFIRTVEQDKSRPEMQYFDGIAGLAQAYRTLLDCGTELLTYLPLSSPTDEDPLREFKAEWLRSRRKRGIFTRVIAHDTVLGRRYRSRDTFEHRRTVLVPEEQYPFTFEKILCGDTIACFNLERRCACLLRFPELAVMERGLFESIERHALAAQEDRLLIPASLTSIVTKRGKNSTRSIFAAARHVATRALNAVRAPFRRRGSGSFGSAQDKLREPWRAVGAVRERPLLDPSLRSG